MPKPTTTPPTSDLFRMNPWPSQGLELRDDEAAGGGHTLVGYAAVFDVETIIGGWEGNFREVIKPGAFAKTLKERGDKVKVLFNHGFDPSIGDKPLGKATVMREDSTGLWIEVPLDDTSYNQDIKALLRSGALDGMSFRFSVVRETWAETDEDDPELPLRELQEVKLYELGIVTFPAYDATTAGVRSASGYAAWKDTHREAGGAANSGTPPAAPPQAAAADAPAAPALRDEAADEWLAAHSAPPAIVAD